MDLFCLSQETIVLICAYSSPAAVCFVQQTAKHVTVCINGPTIQRSAGSVRLQWTPSFAKKETMALLNFETPADEIWKVFEIQLQELLGRKNATVQTILYEIARNNWFADCKWLQDEATVKALAQQALKKLGDSKENDDCLLSVVNALEDQGEYWCLDVLVLGEHVSNLMLSDEVYRNYALSDDEHDGCTILHLIGLLVIFSGTVTALGEKFIQAIRRDIAESKAREKMIQLVARQCGLAVPDFGQGSQWVSTGPRPSGRPARTLSDSLTCCRPFQSGLAKAVDGPPNA